MTPERWRRIDDLFDAALRLDPADREAWLREACGDDEALRAEVGRLLAQDEGAARDGFLTPPEAPGRTYDQTGSWHPAAPATADRPGGPTSVGTSGAADPRRPASPRRRRSPADGAPCTDLRSRRTWSGRGCANCR